MEMTPESQENTTKGWPLGRASFVSGLLTGALYLVDVGPISGGNGAFDYGNGIEAIAIALIGFGLGFIVTLLTFTVLHFLKVRPRFSVTTSVVGIVVIILVIGKWLWK